MGSLPGTHHISSHLSSLYFLSLFPRYILFFRTFASIYFNFFIFFPPYNIISLILLFLSLFASLYSEFTVHIFSHLSSCYFLSNFSRYLFFVPFSRDIFNSLCFFSCTRDTHYLFSSFFTLFLRYVYIFVLLPRDVFFGLFSLLFLSLSALFLVHLYTFSQFSQSILFDLFQAFD